MRLKAKNGIIGCSAEGHVSHVLSSRMSSRPMGWSKKGAGKVVQLREWYYNKQSMLKLAKYQQEVNTLPLAAGAEELITSARDILLSERNERSATEKEYVKYSEAISHQWSLQTKKQLSFYINHWLWNS